MKSGIDKRRFPRFPPGVEKRKHLRVPIENVTVEVYNGNGETGTPEVCDILNVSEAGLLFETFNKYKSKQTLRITFALPDSIVIIRTNAHVVHQFWQDDTGYVGIQFHKIGVAERTNLQTFIGRQNPVPAT